MNSGEAPTKRIYFAHYFVVGGGGGGGGGGGLHQETLSGFANAPTIPRLDLNLRVGVGIFHQMIRGLPLKPAGVITAAVVN